MKGKESLETVLYEAWHFNPRFDKWDEIKEDIAKIEKTCFGSKGWAEDRLEEEFADPENIAIYVHEAQQGIVFGYTLAEPKDDDPKTAYVSSTAILPEYQKRGYLGLMMNRLQGELQHKGFKYMERDAAIGNGYADSIQRHFGDRVVESRDHDSDFGRQRFFRIDIRPYWERGKR